MRLWHENLLPLLPRQQLLGQHRECCALRGNSWGKPHSVVDYVFRYSLERLWSYHIQVMNEMKGRGYNPESCWIDPGYRGKSAPRFQPDYREIQHLRDEKSEMFLVYPEHNEKYLNECLENLRSKGIIILFEG
ncbi:TIGR02328 family protein [Desulfosporosinus nitroreducens]|uniref:TIGR02328 family protein n=1 Tax=Desulfosporosinus nitroreducens TaxID=2018668 RepID=A0ABT8QS92_9FIRM|nr:TIGR02328 family protein [Desulfosporosinus nitroreducens]MDO0822751.1 TIGR02328 family protein [Desulfosporosinus nitroreducens]